MRPYRLEPIVLVLMFAAFLLGSTDPASAQPQCTPLPDADATDVEVTHAAAAPDVAVLDDGSAIAVFTTSQSDGDDRGIFRRRIGANGSPLGAIEQVNTWVSGRQEYARIAANASGRSVVVWDSHTSPGDMDGRSVRARVFGANGSPIGPDFRVNVETSGSQRRAAVAMADDGQFTVVWYDDDALTTAGRGREIKMRRFSASGTPLGGEILVNTLTDGNQVDPDIAMHPDGRTVVAWGNLEGNRSVRARRFDANGQPLDTDEFTVNTAGTWASPRVAIDENGSFLVVWHSRTSLGNDSDFTSVQARGFLWSGVPASPQLQVNERIDDDQFDAEVAAVGGGAFLVVWDSQSRDPVSTRDQPVASRAMTAEGQFQGPELVVRGGALNPAVDANRKGDSMVLMTIPGAIHFARAYEHPCAKGGAGPVGCVPSPTTLCLTQGGRFQVTAVWQTSSDAGDGQAIELTPDTGYFWFFSKGNVEAVVKVLDACQISGHFWVFAGGLTDVEVDLTVTDTQTGAQRNYRNPRSTPFQPIQDTSAFATCP